ncbi:MULTISPECIES: SDR family NAD(P)-dependent oxidoreductase [Hydrogenophaga]|uniref:Short chain dehydrogenase n=1 Tax=Hydrogenophaga intermedia TaxID=65786 RepID=A0A1L1PPP6_HYDIT|nr:MULTISPECIES: SDR family NAD(P)-dependent oxidoreductase [Hydrogenophaga]AOS78085.1 beta-ketoacyl-ACP reductase [Hydrogenophaga sp. PBC]TMU76270.1 SDR family oxidoreductase [Hydrogenophaga intermedia]CDN89733.1 Short chain dehydrogenase [Hydrogenophaga intermedia]
MELNLKGKVALVTGSGRGIGAAMVKAYAAEGARVVVSDVIAENAQATAQALVDQGHEAIGLACDVTDAESVRHMAQQAEQAFGGVDILVNNAAWTKDVYLTKMDPSLWDQTMDVILKGSFHCAQALLPGMMARRWGRVINISSRSLFGNPGQTSYAAAKAGIVGFTRALALEQGKFGITCNAIAPGFILTEGMKSLPKFEQLREAAIARNPVGFLGEPSDVANAALFLSSDVARYISGTTLYVTGGRYSS